MKKVIKIAFPWLMVVAIMALIFYFSSQVADQSNELSTGITEKISEVLTKSFSFTDISVKTMNHFVRKGAHFTIYAALGFMLAYALVVSEMKLRWAWVIGTVYAMTDELHQMFVPGRGPMLRDVFLDSLGVLFGIGCFMVLLWFIKKIIKRK